MGISDYLKQITELTTANIKLLKALNESFYADKDYVVVDTNEGSFTIPSFVSLENKIDALQSNFDNLVNSPETGEAAFVFDGDSRTIEVRKFEQPPLSVSLDSPLTFEHENNDVLKDFLTPIPYVSFNLNNLPNDITSTVTRKVAALSDNMKNKFSTLLGDNVSKTISWGDVYKLLDGMIEDEDYVLYDTTSKLPIKNGVGEGKYVIKEIKDDYTDENLDQHVELVFANNIDGYQKNLSYLLFDQTIEKPLAVGNYLVSGDGCTKFQIEEINTNTNLIKLRIMYGNYINLSAYPGSGTIEESSVMKFFTSMDAYSLNNTVKVPLEEDQYVYIAIAPMNDRMNIRAAWGSGVLVDVYKLKRNDAEVGEDDSFQAYYKNCRNIGDILNEISIVMKDNTISDHTKDEINGYMSAKPVIDPDIIKVVHINKHLNDSDTIKNIRSLYSQKNEENAKLTEIQTSLVSLQKQLATIDFQDTTGIRDEIENQINNYIKQKNSIIDSLLKTSNQIALIANDSIIPIEEEKYRIRGFFDFVSFAESVGVSEKNIKGICVQYQYRNPQLENSNAVTYFKKESNNIPGTQSDESYVFSSWNQLYTPLRPRVYKDGEYIAEDNNSNSNTPSFNQIDIPITQGEDVDVKLKVIYDFGYPFIQITSDWSDVVTFEFPIEFLQNISVVDIIKENNNDIETNRFEGILRDNGITSHVDDFIQDQDVVYFHKPKNIASGFYTAERRIIPLEDKLKEMDNILTLLKDEVEGTFAESLGVNFDFDESSVALSPFEPGNVTLKGYSELPTGTPGVSGNYNIDSDGLVSILCGIRLTNKTSHALKIFSLFPASNDEIINRLSPTAFDVKNYSAGDDDPEDVAKGIYYLNSDGEYVLQTANQIITFRINNPYNHSEYYASGVQLMTSKLSLDEDNMHSAEDSPDPGMWVYPVSTKTNGLKMTTKDANKYMIINPGEEYIIPVMVEYIYDDASDSVTKTISFDIRNSLYSDPINYTLNITTKYEATVVDKLISSVGVNADKYNPIIG